jgi:hypothetical protein
MAAPEDGKEIPQLKMRPQRALSPETQTVSTSYSLCVEDALFYRCAMPLIPQVVSASPQKVNLLRPGPRVAFID